MANETILVVDDSPEIVRFLKSYVLVPMQYNVLTAADGQAGFKMATSNPVDLIMLDMNMPKMTGLEMLVALRQTECKAPVVFMTVHGSENIAVEVFRLGVRDYLVKPFTVDEVREIIDRALREVRLAKEKEALSRDLVASDTVRQTVVTLSHYINNNLMILNGGVSLLIEGLQKEGVDKAYLLGILRDCKGSVGQIETVMRVLQRVTKVKQTAYFGQSNMLDIDTALREEQKQQK
jgi:DNA-binding NtrC family response regulator